MIHYSVLLLALFLRALDTQTTCPCNLVTDACELSCCCDTDCAREHTQDLTFCSPTSVARDTLRSFPHQLLAVSRDNSPFLGLFYPNPANITSELFDPLVSRNQRFQPPPRTSPPLTPSSQYRYGDALLNTTDSYTHYLYSATTGPFGTCVLSPISYLHSSHVSCSSPSLSSPTPVSISPSYLCANYSDWVAVYSPYSPHLIAFSPSAHFYQCSTDIRSCLSSDSCRHLLLSSHTAISWFQGTVLHIQQEIRLLYLPPNISITPVIQSHAISYEFTSTDTLDASSYDTAADENLLPGYIRGAGLLFGIEEGSRGYIRPANGSLISSSSGLCSAIILKKVEFQNNALSGCTLRLPSNFSCSAARQNLLDLFSQLLPTVTHVARSRRSSKLSPDQWVPLLRPPPAFPSNSSLCSLPLRLRMRYLYSHAGNVGSYQILEVTGATAQLEYHEVAFLHNNGEFAVSVSTSAEFISVPLAPSAPVPRSHLKHTPNCQEPCYAPRQVFYPLYQSVSLRGLESPLTRFFSLPSLLDGLYFSFLLAVSTLFILYSLSNSMLF